VKKLQGQCGVLEWLTDPGSQVPLAERDRHRKMRDAVSALRIMAERTVQMTDLDEIVDAERAGAETYWGALEGIPLRWKPQAVAKVPEHGATDPINALLNYGYALLEGETRIVCLNAGLHPGLGIFHVDKDGRASFIYDLMEPVRPAVDRLVMRLVRTHTFAEEECWETREGHCRLDPKLASQAAAWLASLRKSIVPVSRNVAYLLRTHNELDALRQPTPLAAPESQGIICNEA